MNVSQRTEGVEVLVNGVVTMLRAGRRKNRDSICCQNKRFCLLKIIHTGFGDSRASYSLTSRGNKVACTQYGR
jgi:hypothetical protein